MPTFSSPRFYSSLTLSLSITLSLRPHSGFCCHDAIRRGKKEEEDDPTDEDDDELIN